MILAFHATDRGSNPGSAMIFYFLFLLFSVCFCCFNFDLFFFLYFTASVIRQLLHLGIKSQKARYIFIVYRNTALSCVHPHHSCITEPFLTTRMKFLCSMICLQGIYYLSHNLLFSNCLKSLYLSQKQTAEMSIAIQACTICMFGNCTV